MTEAVPVYDIAVSFAGAQRAYVETIVKACEDRGLRVFYDKNETEFFWGRNFIHEMRNIYGGTKARYFVPFISAEYMSSPYPMDEFDIATTQAIERRKDPYILPILVGEVQIPPTLLNPAIGYLRAERYTVDALADVIAERVRAARLRNQQPRDMDDVLENVLQVRLPRTPPVRFSHYDTLDDALTRVQTLFRQTSHRLETYGFTCRVRASQDSLRVRVESQGRPRCELWVRFDTSFGSDRLAVSFAWPLVSGNAMNGWATPMWDPDAGQPKLKYTDLSANANGKPITADQFFHILWDKIVHFIESSTR